MTTLNLQQVRDELCEFLRRSDIMTTTIRGVTRTVSNYTVGAGGESTHTFTGNFPTRDFYSLTVDGTAKYYLRDYTMVWNTGVLTWNTGLTVGQVVAYSIDWSTSSEKIYPDYPREDLTFASFPRVGIEMTSISTQPLGLGGMVHMSDFIITIFVWLPVNKVSGALGGLTDLNEVMRLIRDKIRTNAKSFYTFPYIYPMGMGPLFKGKNDKVLAQSQDFNIKFKVE